MKRPKFVLSFAPEAIEHLDLIESKYHGFLRRRIREQLTSTPTEETRNRKPLVQPAPFEATWELRCGPNNRFRIFYDVDPVSEVVVVLAIGMKDRSRLLIGGEEYELVCTYGRRFESVLSKLGFITIGMYHGLQGCWNVVRDFKLRPWLTYTIFGTLLVLGVIFVGMGWNTMLTFDPNKP